jgi:hypothetical protein
VGSALFSYGLETATMLWRPLSTAEIVLFLDKVRGHQGILEVSVGHRHKLVVMSARIEAENPEAALEIAANSFRDGLHQLGFRTNDITIVTKLDEPKGQKLN